jgi:5-methylthioadenosine/S-adenosylhomocysteine deaminase
VVTKEAIETLIHNGVLVCCNDAFEIIDRGWVGISGGRIQALGRCAEGGPLPAAEEVVDAAGGIVMPGLVNTHTHLPMTLFRGMVDDQPLSVWLNETIFFRKACRVIDTFPSTP